MKLNDYLEKSSKPVAANKTITFVNETKETQLRSEIEELSQKVEQLKEIERQYIETNALAQSLESRLHDSLESVGNLQAKNSMIEADLERLKNAQIEKQDLQEKHNDLLGKFYEQENIINEHLDSLRQATSQIEQNEKQIEGLQNENKAVTSELEGYRQVTTDAQNELSDVNQKFADQTKVFNEIQVKYTDEVKKNSLLSQEISTVESRNKTLESEKIDLEQTRNMLQAWASAIEADREEAEGKSQVNKSEINKLRDAVSEMAQNIDGLISENEYLVGLNNELKLELAKPNYASVGAIERAEGFKLPSGAYFKGKNYLGNGTPTLLAFKEEK